MVISAEIWLLSGCKVLEKNLLLADQASLRLGLGKELNIFVLTACIQEIDNSGISRLLPKSSVPIMYMIFCSLFHPVRGEGIAEIAKWDTYLKKMRIVLLENTVQDSETTSTKNSLCLNLHSSWKYVRQQQQNESDDILLYLLYPEGKQSELWIAHNSILQIRTYFFVKDSEWGYVTSIRSFIIHAWLLDTPCSKPITSKFSACSRKSQDGEIHEWHNN